MDTLLQDIRYGVRMLMKRPGFTVVAIIALALGIGANTAIFSVVNAVLIRPLPYEGAERLASLFITRPDGRSRGALSTADFLTVKEQSQFFEQVAAFYPPPNGFNLTGGESPERVTGAVVTADLFSLLGVSPMMGRTFFPDEDKPGKQSVVVVSYGFWQRNLNSDPNAIGRIITLNNTSTTIIGVMPASFRFPGNGDADLWPVFTLNQPQARAPFFLSTIARLKPAVTEQQARAELDIIAQHIHQQYPNSPADLGFTTLPLKETIVGDTRQALVLLLGAVVLVLLIASVNVANLLLARAAAREREIAIRSALGASRFRIIRQLLTESVLLSVFGGVLGLLLALWGTDLLIALSPDSIPRLRDVSIDGRVLGFTSLISILSGVLFGLAPALQSSRSKLNESLKEGGRGGSENFGRRRLRSALVVSEIALALMLLVGAGLMIKSFIRLGQVNAGFEPDNLLTMQISLPQSKYRQPAQINAFYKQLIERVDALPGVQSASIGMAIPPHLLQMHNPFTREGIEFPPGESPPMAEQVLISEDYFKTLGIPLLNGRFFAEADTPDAPLVMIINETMARTVFSGENPVGQRIKTGGPCATCPWTTIVGVVGDVKYTGLDAGAKPTMYTPYYQNPWWPSMFIAVKTSSPPMGFVAAVRNEVLALDKDLPVASIKTMDQLLYESVAQPRFRTSLLGLFAGVALTLAGVGIYGVMSYSVTQRTHEIGIRMALGAQSSDVVRMVLSQGLKLTAAGVGVGLIGAYLMTRLMTSLLYGVSATDPMTFAGLALILTGVALGASYVPARRATKVDPMIALRYE